MNEAQFSIFSSFRDEFQKKIREWSKYNDELIELQEMAAKNGGTPPYPVQNPVCYNTALDSITREDDIKLILIGDNPGKNEQLDENKKYLVGLAGKLGVKFFAENPELNTDFRKNVIILNKTPVHSARTEHLRWIIKNSRPEIANLIEESQKWMAKATANLHMRLSESANSKVSEGTDPKTKGTDPCSKCSKGTDPQLWLVGYAELKGKGLFLPYRDVLLETYRTKNREEFFKNSVFTYQHFSMNRFTIDLNDYRKQAAPENLEQTLKNLGSLHRKEIFGV